MTEQTSGNEDSSNSRVLLGLVIALIGVAILVEKNDGWVIDLGGVWWEFLLVFLGLAKMVAPGERDGRQKSRRGGFLLLSIGAWALASKAEVFGLDASRSWPLLVIAVGITIVWGALEHPPIRRIQER